MILVIFLGDENSCSNHFLWITLRKTARYLFDPQKIHVFLALSPDMSAEQSAVLGSLQISSLQQAPRV